MPPKYIIQNILRVADSKHGFDSRWANTQLLPEMGTEWQRVRATDQSRFSIEEQERDALALLQALGVQRSHVIGHSYGAVTALQLACDAPLAGRSLVLLEPPKTMDTWEAR